MRFPFVIWQGRGPMPQNNRTNRTFRLVNRGPARADRPDDVPFSIEQRIGVSMMKRFNWAFPTNKSETDGAQREALWALAHAFGELLMVDPKRLNLDHPLHCEINLAIAAGREPVGCDCDGPEEPE